jgi:predicted amidophosphoribosyltransferase
MSAIAADRLQPCPDCHEWISPRARFCPHCGRPRRGFSAFGLALKIVAVLFALFLLGLVALTVLYAAGQLFTVWPR